MCSSVTLCHPERERGAWGSEGAITHRPCPQVPRWARDDIHCYAECRMDLHLALDTRHFFQALQQSLSPRAGARGLRVRGARLRTALAPRSLAALGMTSIA